MKCETVITEKQDMTSLVDKNGKKTDHYFSQKIAVVFQ